MRLTIAIVAAAVYLGPITSGEQERSGRSSAGADPRRIIATAPSNAEIVCALGAADRLVGISRYVSYPQAVQGLPKVGGLHDPDLEAILALRPDLILLRGKNIHLQQLCDNNGIRVYYDNTDSLPSLFVTITELGHLLGLPEEARRVSDALHKRLDAVRSQARDRPRPRVLLTLRSPDKLGSLTTVAQGSYLHAVLELAGGENVFGDLDVAYPQISLEEIIARQPELIIEAMPGESIDAARRAQLLAQWNALTALEAARSGRIHFLTDDYVLIPSPRVALLAEKLAAILAAEVQPSEP